MATGEASSMADTTTSEAAALARQRAADLEARGELRAAIEVLTDAAHAEPRADYLRELVRLRRAAGREVLEIDAADLTAAAIRDGIARCGCLLVRGFLDADRAERLARGIDATIEG